MGIKKSILLNLVNPNEDILDFGCGTGEYSTFLEGRARRIIGLDQSEVALNLARKRSPGIFFENNLLRLPDSTFTSVLSINVFQHILPGSLSVNLRELKRLLAPNGKIIVINSFAPQTFFLDPYTVLYSMKEFSSILLNAGLVVETVTPFWDPRLDTSRLFKIVLFVEKLANKLNISNAVQAILASPTEYLSRRLSSSSFPPESTQKILVIRKRVS